MLHRGTGAVLALFLLGLTFGETRADDLGPICPDRPGKGTSPCTLAQGRFQVEAGLYDGTFQHRDGVTTDDTTAGSILLKYGVSDAFDAEAGLTLYQGERVHDGAADATVSGFGDLYLRGKWMALSDGPLTAVVEPFLKLPTATNGTGNGRLEGGLVLPLGYDLGGAGAWARPRRWMWPSTAPAAATTPPRSMWWGSGGASTMG